MPEERYPTPYREGVYQDGLRRAIMQRVSGSAPSPSGVPRQVIGGPLMTPGRIRRPFPYRVGRPGFDATRPLDRVLPEQRLQVPPPPYVAPIAERGGGPFPTLDFWKAIADRLRGLASGGEGRGMFERLPMERRGRPDVFAALEPEPDPWAGMTPEMMQLLQQLFRSGLGG